MTHRQDVALGRDITARWCALAEQRLQHLTELFESGRWRRYHSEEAFLENIQEAKRAVEMWRELSTPGYAHKRVAARVEWPARPAARPLLTSAPPLQTVQPKSVQIAVENPVPIAAPAQTSKVELGPHAEFLLPDEERPGPPATPSLVEFTLDVDGVKERYPLLRNVF